MSAYLSRPRRLWAFRAWISGVRERGSPRKTIRSRCAPLPDWREGEARWRLPLASETRSTPRRPPDPKGRVSRPHHMRSPVPRARRCPHRGRHPTAPPGRREPRGQLRGEMSGDLYPTFLGTWLVGLVPLLGDPSRQKVERRIHLDHRRLGRKARVRRQRERHAGRRSQVTEQSQRPVRGASDLVGPDFQRASKGDPPHVRIRRAMKGVVRFGFDRGPGPMPRQSGFQRLGPTQRCVDRHEPGSLRPCQFRTNIANALSHPPATLVSRSGSEQIGPVDATHTPR